MPDASPKLAALFASPIVEADDPPEPIMRLFDGPDAEPCDSDDCPAAMCREHRRDLEFMGSRGRWPDDSDLDRTEPF